MLFSQIINTVLSNCIYDKVLDGVYVCVCINYKALNKFCLKQSDMVLRWGDGHIVLKE